MRLFTEDPHTLVSTFPLAIQTLDIRPGEAESVHRQVFRNYRSEPMRLVSFTPHMHLLGTEIGLRRVPALAADGDPECLIDVPRWDFNWQQSYVLRADDPVELLPGEGLELTCVYDNSASNQPVINGEQVEPRAVTWGEGTLDEMCLLYVSETEPWAGAPTASGCDAANDCLASCETNDAQCLLACEGVGIRCRICALQESLGCARSTCLSTLAPAVSCIQSCILSYALIGGSFDRCMETECPSGTWAPARDCIAGVVDAGTCDEGLTGCGITR